MNLSAEGDRLAEQSLRIGWPASLLPYCQLAVFSIAVGIGSGAALADGKGARDEEFQKNAGQDHHCAAVRYLVESMLPKFASDDFAPCDMSPARTRVHSANASVI